MSQVRGRLQSCDKSKLTLDVATLAELQHLRVPHTDDSLKYQYYLEGDTYGISHWDG